MKRILIISDGKPGHLNQSLGLAEALQRRCEHVQVETVAALKPLQALLKLSAGRDRQLQADLLIAAGHRTHLSLLALKRASGAAAVLMMTPSLPKRLFDLCLIPRHDRPAIAPNVVETDGALNRMQAGSKQPRQGMVLIGGPSKHFGWDSAQLIAQLESICDGTTNWLLTTSRRTPEDFLPALRVMDLPGLEIVPFEDTGPGWLATELPRASQCWVSEDSVSMVYEALTAGCAVGVLAVPANAVSRVSKGVRLLADDRKITLYRDWSPGTTLQSPAAEFNEAERCAQIVLQRGLL
ncbi:mitochondrial fission ELM1 family protein [Marinobacterium jannaschii]|uniref:mitochondrial fission ELM1 family protein n=1 Tax=Marinobacterium jannaschii TaxID=64970 RepID=UPI0004864E2D|nr:mitochondrial fission ELM1 family protein [Marinobacterium jannaschii]